MFQFFMVNLMCRAIPEGLKQIRPKPSNVLNKIRSVTFVADKIKQQIYEQVFWEEIQIITKRIFKDFYSFIDLENIRKLEMNHIADFGDNWQI